MRDREREREMVRNREKEEAESRLIPPVSISVADSSISLIKVVSTLIIFVLGVIIGLVSSFHLHKYFTFEGDQFSFKSIYFETQQFSSHDNQMMLVSGERDDCLRMERFTRPRNLIHQMTDNELFWRASLVPQKEEFPFRRVPRVAFMFLTRGPLPMLPFWERFFTGQDVEKYSIYVHALPGFELEVSNSSVFYRRQIPSQV